MAYEGSSGKVSCRYCRTVVGKRSHGGFYQMCHLKVAEMKPMFMSYGTRTAILIDARVINITVSALPPTSYYLKPLLQSATASSSFMLPASDPSAFVSRSVPPLVVSGPSTSSVAMSGGSAFLTAPYSGSSSLLQTVPSSAPEVRRKKVRSTPTESVISAPGSDHIRSLLNATIPRLENLRSCANAAVDLTAGSQQIAGENISEDGEYFLFFSYVSNCIFSSFFFLIFQIWMIDLVSMSILER